MEACSLRSGFPARGLGGKDSGTRHSLKKGSQETPVSEWEEDGVGVGRREQSVISCDVPSFSLIQRGALQHKLCLRVCLS